jgi:hypothetical protein
MLLDFRRNCPVRSRSVPFAGIRRRTEASVLIELALVGSFLVMTATGLTDLAIAIWEQLQVRDAATAGVAYVIHYGYDASGIQTAASLATPTSVTVSSWQSCGCAGAGGVQSASCGSICSSGAQAGSYVTVTASTTYQPPVPFPGISAMTLSSTVTIRVN